MANGTYENDAMIAPQGALVSDTTTERFATDVVEASAEHTILVDFWAPWCGPCKQLTPLLEKAVNAAGGAVKLVKMDIEAHPQVAGQMGIQSIPAVVAFKNGQPVDGFMGSLPESEIAAFIEKVSGGAVADPISAAFDAAQAQLEAGDFKTAAEGFNAVYQADTGHVGAICGLARCALGMEDLERAKQILSMVPSEKHDDEAYRTAIMQIDMAEQAGDAGELETLAEQVLANPNDHKARFDLALVLNSQNKRQESADQLLEIVRRDRIWEDDGARKELLKLFEVWGSKEPATSYARRQLSSLLFS